MRQMEPYDVSSRRGKGFAPRKGIGQIPVQFFLDPVYAFGSVRSDVVFLLILPAHNIRRWSRFLSTEGS